MPLKADFDKMTLDELTPIVSMRPGKEYTKEELHAARLAFMEKLGCANPEVETEDETEEMVAPTEEAPVLPPVIDTPEAPFEDAPKENEEQASPEELPPEAEVPSPDNGETAEETVPEDVPAAEEPSAPEEEAKTESEEAPQDAEVSEDKEALKEAPAPCEEDKEEFILKADSRLARFLYLLYTYFFIPVLAVESILLLVASVGTSVAVSNTPYIVLHVVCAAVYAMIISLSWQQFLCRTTFGILMNRTLICTSLMRGFIMLISGSDVLIGIIFVALSALFLIYFIGYDNMFTVKKKKQHAQ